MSRFFSTNSKVKYDKNYEGAVKDSLYLQFISKHFRCKNLPDPSKTKVANVEQYQVILNFVSKIVHLRHG